ncbi:MAG: alpha/beta hydrolase [Chitinophagaceae bacterium]|nr:alpha/beta hydrolase [Chitinophagaceae bacterium]
MKIYKKLIQLLVAVLPLCIHTNAQTISPDLQDRDKWRLVNRIAQPVTEEGKKGIRVSETPNDGAMILKDFEFGEGIIELDIRGKNVLQQSFVGVAFHGQDSSTYDAIYFRPFNFVNTDTARRSRAVQYISMPGFPWEKLRQDHPGKYENKVHPVPNPDAWFHVKITVTGKQIKVFVDNAGKPCLEVEKLTGTTKGDFALWVGNNSGAAFANLRITRRSTGTSAATIPYGNNPETGKYFNAGDARLYYEVYGNGDPILMLHGGVYGYISEFEHLIPKLAENHRVICLATRGHGKSEIGRQPYTYKQRAEDAYSLLKHLNISKASVIGFSDGAYSGYKMAALYPETVIKLVAMGAGDKKNNASTERFNYNETDLLKTAGNYFAGLRKLMPEPQRWNETLAMLNNLYNNDVISNETFEKIKCPVLVMAGDKDNYSNIDKVVSSYKQIPGAMLSIIPGCGHVIFYCNFPAVWEAMKGFVNNEIKKG